MTVEHVTYSAICNDRSCVICHATFDAGTTGRTVVHCCPACGHSLKSHSDGMKCRVCKNPCGIDCRPSSLRAHDRWPVKFPWLV